MKAGYGSNRSLKANEEDQIHPFILQAQKTQARRGEAPTIVEVDKRTIASVEAAVEVGKVKGRTITQARREAVHDPRNAVTHSVTLDIFCKNRMDALKGNMDATQFLGTVDNEGCKILVCKAGQCNVIQFLEERRKAKEEAERKQAEAQAAQQRLRDTKSVTDPLLAEAAEKLTCIKDLKSSIVRCEASSKADHIFTKRIRCKGMVTAEDARSNAEACATRAKLVWKESKDDLKSSDELVKEGKIQEIEQLCRRIEDARIAMVELNQKAEEYAQIASDAKDEPCSPLPATPPKRVRTKGKTGIELDLAVLTPEQKQHMEELYKQYASLSTTHK